MSVSKNQHLLDYLGYYLSLTHSPHYAVLISGPWGVGKTYQVKQFLQRHQPKPEKLLYVSLYGLSTLDEIRDALFQAAYPLLTGKPAKIMRTFTFSMTLNDTKVIKAPH